MKGFELLNPSKVSFLWCTDKGAGAGITYESIVKSNKFCYHENLWLMMMKVFTHLSKFYKRDGSYNLEAEEIEKYAMCLYHDGLPAETVKIFDAIFTDRSEILCTELDSCQRLEAFTLQPKKLGYAGLLVYGQACLALGQKTKALKLLSELIDKIPATTGTFHSRDVRVEAIEIMLKIKPSLKLRQLLKEAKAHQY